MKKTAAWVLSILLAASVLTGCGKSAGKETTAPETTKAAETETVKETETEKETETSAAASQTADNTVIRVGGLKGPTTMGMVKLLDDAENGASGLSVEFTMAASADELTPKLLQGELDILAAPANLASVLYNKSEGKVQFAAVNTLGVLYIVEKGEARITSFADLKGKTIYATGKGSTPEYALNYLLTRNGLDPEKDVAIEWKSEPTEVVSLLAGQESGIAMLPQPFVTVAKGQVEGLEVALDLTKEWEALDNTSMLITAGLIVRKAFAEEHPDALAAFLKEYQASTAYINEHVEEGAALVEKYDIVKAAVAKQAIPACNITYLDGEDMKTALSGYLQILFEQNPQAVGGAMPGDDFYLVK